MKLTATAFIALAGAGLASAQPAATTPANLKVRYLIGLDTPKGNSTGTLALQDGVLQFKTGKTDAKVPVSSIDDIFIGTEVTQSGGKTGRVVKTAAMAAPFESGKALTILLRTKVDILTVAFHDQDGAVFLPACATRPNFTPRRREVAMACSPATPQPITNTRAGVMVPAAVVSIGKMRG